VFAAPASEAFPVGLIGASGVFGFGRLDQGGNLAARVTKNLDKEGSGWVSELVGVAISVAISKDEEEAIVGEA
jgi:hypothetical protein